MQTRGHDHPQSPDVVTGPAPGTRRTPSARTVWFGVFVLAAALYVATANRGPQWQDSGLQQLRIVSGQIENTRGLALTHPLQYYLGRAAIRLPIAEPAFAITLISSFAGAIAIANLATAVHLLTQRAAAALIASAALMLSHTFWQHATHTESYALTAALLTTEWLCLAAYARSGRTVLLLVLGLANGLGIANHLLALLATPVDALVIAAALRKKHLATAGAAAAVLWLAGTLPFTLLVASTAAESGEIAATLRSAFFGRYADAVLNVRLSMHTLMLSAGYVVYNFPGFTVPLAICAIYAAWMRPSEPRWLLRVLSIELLIYAAYVFRYSIADQYTFFFPVYLLLALFAGVALAKVMSLKRGTFRAAVVSAAALTAVWTPIVYMGTCAILRSRGVFSSMVGNKPYRDGYRTFFVPWGLGDDAAQRANQQVAALAGADGLVLIADSMMGFGVRYAQAVGGIPATVEIAEAGWANARNTVGKWRDELSAVFEDGRPVVLVPKDRDLPDTGIPGTHWERCGDVYRLISLEARPASAPTTPD